MSPVFYRKTEPFIPAHDTFQFFIFYEMAVLNLYCNFPADPFEVKVFRVRFSSATPERYIRLIRLAFSSGLRCLTNAFFRFPAIRKADGAEGITFREFLKYLLFKKWWRFIWETLFSQMTRRKDGKRKDFSICLANCRKNHLFDILGTNITKFNHFN